MFDRGGPAQGLQARSWIRILFAAYGLFVIYGSLVPLKFTPWPWPWHEALAAFVALPVLDFDNDSRTDFATNLLLFVPLAFLAAQAAAPAGGARPGLRALLFAAALGLALGLEFTQLFIPRRMASLDDVLAESLGAAIGLVLQARWGARFRDWFDGFWTLQTRDSKVRRLLGTYVVLLFLFNLMPLDLTISPAEIHAKWRQGGVVLVPFAGLRGDAAVDAYELATDALIWLPAGLLWALDGPAPVWRRVVLKGLWVSALVEFIQLFVLTRTPDVTDVLMAVVGVVLGALAVRLRHAWAGPDEQPPPRLLLGAGLAWLAVVLALFWFPFDWHAESASWASARAAITRVPFTTYFFRSEFGGLNEMLRRVLAFLPGGLLLGWLASSRAAAGGSRPRWPLAVLLVLALAVEAGQLLLPGKVSDITDVAFEWLGGVIGCAIAAWLRHDPNPILGHGRQREL